MRSAQSQFHQVAAVTSHPASKTMIKKFLKDETGLELSEYAVAAALVAIAVAGVFMALGETITGRINELSGHITAGK